MNVPIFTILIVLFCATSATKISDQISDIKNQENVSKETPQNYTGMTWKELAESILCSSDGDPKAIYDALVIFEDNIDVKGGVQ